MGWFKRTPPVSKPRVVCPKYGNPMGYCYRARIHQGHGQWICTIDRHFTVWEYTTQTHSLPKRKQRRGDNGGSITKS